MREDLSLRVGIVGLGLIGGSMAKAFHEYTNCSVLGYDSNPAVLEAAEACGAIDRAGGWEDLARLDLLILAIYPQAAVDFIREHGTQIPRSCLVTDTCGIKTQVCAELSALAKEFGFRFVGSHPMAGREKVGFAASEASLFRGASYLITPCGASDEDVALLERTAEALGFGRCVVTTPEKHDRMIAFTSQVPHALACAYVLSPQCPDHKGFSAGSYRDVSRVANINETLWMELFLSNAGPLTAELDTLIENLSAVRDAIHDGDAQRLSSLLRQGRLVKESLGE